MACSAYICTVKKAQGKRHRLMALLMISSQLLLTAFVLYWLSGQYREERMQLHSQLTQEYYRIHDQLVDSMLLKRLVIPSLDDSLMMEISLPEPDMFEAEPGPDSATTVVMMKQFFVNVPDSIEQHHVTTIISDEERMVKGVRLFIDQNPEAFQNDTGLHVFAMNLDSSSLVQNMKGTLKERKWDFNLQWPVEESNLMEAPGYHGMLLGGGGSRNLPVLGVQGVFAFLIRSIIPQILFALILLLLSGSALIFAYRSLRKQLALNKLRNNFVGNISHELKTPVSTVKVALEALRTYDMHKDPEVADKYLSMAASELERLERLVGKVLHHELLDKPSLVLEKEICHPNDLALSVMRTLEIPIREADARVSFMAGSETCRIFVDRIYVEGVIMNLLDNSLKYGGENPEIEIKIHCDSSGTYLSVEDRGPGIPDEYKDQVFEKFYRVPNGDRHNIKGYGLGLNFAAQVMDQHGGSISFMNLKEGGCRFTLSFPVKNT